MRNNRKMKFFSRILPFHERNWVAVSRGRDKYNEPCMYFKSSFDFSSSYFKLLIDIFLNIIGINIS